MENYVELISKAALFKDCGLRWEILIAETLYNLWEVFLLDLSLLEKADLLDPRQQGLQLRLAPLLERFP